MGRGVCASRASGGGGAESNAFVSACGDIVSRDAAAALCWAGLKAGWRTHVNVIRFRDPITLKSPFN